MRKLLIASWLGLAVACSACSSDESEVADPSAAPSASADVIEVTAQYVEQNVLGEADSCEVGEKAVSAGTQVELLDADGAVVSTSTFAPVANINSAGRLCQWAATFSDVPTGGRFYTARVGALESSTVAESQVAETNLVIRG